MKKVIIVAGVAVVVAFLIVWAMNALRANDGSDEQVQSATATKFAEAARARVNEEVGRPIEGYEPFMFMEVYPDLTERDFDGVEALIGGYVYADGALAYDAMGEKELHSAARAISDEGMQTLLANIAARLDLDVAGQPDAVVETVEGALGAGTTNGEGIGESMARFEGEIVCLPHANVAPGQPVTMECAFGLQVDSGLYFGLNFAAMSMMYMPEAGQRVVLQGRLVEPEDAKYDIQGTILVTSIIDENAH